MEMDEAMRHLQQAVANEVVADGANVVAAGRSSLQVGGQDVAALQDQRQQLLDAMATMASTTPLTYRAVVSMSPEAQFSCGKAVTVRFEISPESLQADSAAKSAISGADHPAFMHGDLSYDSDDGSPSDRDFIAVYSAESPGGTSGGRHDMAWLPFTPSGDGITQWRAVHSKRQSPLELLQGTVVLRLPQMPGEYQVRLVNRRGQVAASSQVFRLKSQLHAQQQDGSAEVCSPTAALPPCLPAPVAAVLQGRRAHQEGRQLEAERQEAHGAAVDAGTVTTHATVQDMASVSQWSANSNASQHTAATSVFTYTLLRRFVASGAPLHMPAAGADGSLLVIRPPYALQVNEAVGSSTLFLTLPPASSAWQFGSPEKHVSSSGFVSIAVPVTKHSGGRLLLLWEAALSHSIDASACTLQVQAGLLTWRLKHASRPRRVMHLQLERPPTAELEAEAQALAAAPGALRCAQCDAALSEVTCARRAPSASWSAWMDHWLCHTEERGHLLPRHEITPAPREALVAADEFVLHPTAFRPGSVFLCASHQRSSLSQLQWETRSTAAQAQAAVGDAAGQVQICAVHCTRCRGVVGETVVLQSALDPDGRCSLLRAFPNVFEQTPAQHGAGSAVQPAVQIVKAECTLVHSTAAAEIEAGVARGSVFSSYEWFLAQVCAVPRVHRDMCAGYSWTRLIVRRALEESTSAGKYHTVLYCQAGHCEDSSQQLKAVELRLQSWAAQGAASSQPVAFSVLDKGRFLRMEPSIAPASRRLTQELFQSVPGEGNSSSSSRQLETMSRLCVFKWRQCSLASPPAGDDNTVVLQVAPHVAANVIEELGALAEATPQSANLGRWQQVWIPVRPVDEACKAAPH